MVRGCDDAQQARRDCLRLCEIGADPRRQRWCRARSFVRLACRQVWRNVARQSKTNSRVATPIVMIPALDVESILRTWTPDRPCDIPLKGAQAASRQPSQPTRPGVCRFVGRAGETRSHLYTRAVRSRDARMPPLLFDIPFFPPRAPGGPPILPLVSTRTSWDASAPRRAAFPIFFLPLGSTCNHLRAFPFRAQSRI